MGLLCKIFQGNTSYKTYKICLSIILLDDFRKIFRTSQDTIRLFCKRFFSANYFKEALHTKLTKYMTFGGRFDSVKLLLDYFVRDFSVKYFTRALRIKLRKYFYQFLFDIRRNTFLTSSAIHVLQKGKTTC